MRWMPSLILAQEQNPEIDPEVSPEAIPGDGPPADSPEGVASQLDRTGEKAGDLVSDAFGGDTDALTQLAVDYGLPAVLMLLVLIVAYFVGKFLGRAVSSPVTKKVDPTLGKFTGKLVFYIVMIGALLGVLGKVGVSVASFAAVIAAAGFAVGLAFQGTLSNFAAGVMLLVFRPFKVGDVINAAGITAKVDEIDLFTTSFDTPDNRHIVVPNSSIFGSTIENITHHPERRVDVAVGCDYSASLDKTREVLTKAVESVEGRIDGEGRGFQIFLSELGGSSVDWAVRVWFPTADYWAKKEELIRAVKMHLDDAGIGIPFPQMDVHVDGKLGN
ncbi:MAG: mechanosensitive ion channel domain-containing protein [Planctomycetota bacterium]